MKLILPLITFFGALYGVYHYLKTVEENTCDMTYMFEYPQYLKVPLNYSTSAKFPRYNLYVYAEGKYAEDLSNARRFQGFPVLFIPGNAGSHRQVRSLASVSLRISQSRQTTLHFNFFTIDFNEEISALYGGTLNDQTEFVLECMRHIQALYSQRKKLILIGHSMGGVLAKAVFSLPEFEPSDVSLILTLASPHRKPVLALDSDIIALYERVRHAWKHRLKAELKTIPVVSIGGSRRDTIVRSDLTLNKFEHSSSLDIHALTSAIPGVWMSTDHLAVVWCKQLVLTICRSLFDVCSLEVDKAATESSDLESILRFHYVSKSSGSRWPSSWLMIPFQAFPSSAQWIEQSGNTWRFARSKVLSSIYILIPFSRHDSILIVASGLVKGDWIYGCTQLSTAASKTCAEGENLSSRGSMIPSRKPNVERRMVRFKVQDLQQKGFLSLIIYVAPVDSQVEILGEAYSEGERTKHFKLPSMLERLFSLVPHRVFTISLVEQIVYYNVTVSQSAGIFQAVEFQLETRLCRAGSVVGQGLVKMHIPWSNSEDSFYHVRASLGGVTHIPAAIHSLPPAGANPDVNLLFIFDPECSVVLTAKFPFYLMASQFMKFYGTYLGAYTVAFLLLLLADEMHSFASEGLPLSVYEIFGKLSSFILLVVVPSVFYHVLWILDSPVSFLPRPDALEDETYDFFSSLLVRTLLHLAASGLIACLCLAVELLLRMMTALWTHFMCKSILKTTQMPLEKNSKDRVRISRTVLIGSSTLFAICVGISSSLASAITSVCYFFKLASMHTRCKLEEDRRGSSVATRKWYFHVVLVLLWCVMVVLTGPGLVTWIRNLHFSFRLSRDVYLLPCVMMVSSVAILWQLPAPVSNRSKYGVVVMMIKSVAVVVTLYGISSMYRLLYAITTVFVIVCIQQTWAYLQLAYLKRD